MYIYELSNHDAFKCLVLGDGIVNNFSKTWELMMKLSGFKYTEPTKIIGSLVDANIGKEFLDTLAVAELLRGSEYRRFTFDILRNMKLDNNSLHNLHKTGEALKKVKFYGIKESSGTKFLISKCTFDFYDASWMEGRGIEMVLRWDKDSTVEVEDSYHIQDTPSTSSLVLLIKNDLQVTPEMLGEQIKDSLMHYGGLKALACKGISCVTNNLKLVCNSNYINKSSLCKDFVDVTYDTFTCQASLTESYNETERSKLDVWNQAKMDYASIVSEEEGNTLKINFIKNMNFQIPPLDIEYLANENDWSDDFFEYFYAKYNEQYSEGSKIQGFNEDAPQLIPDDSSFHDKYLKELDNICTDAIQSQLSQSGLDIDLEVLKPLMRFEGEDAPSTKEINAVIKSLLPTAKSTGKLSLNLFKLTVSKDTFYLISEQALPDLLSDLSQGSLGIVSETTFLNMTSIDVIRQADTIKVNKSDQIYKEYQSCKSKGLYYLFEE